MKHKNQPIILIGFKHTGKSSVGKILAEKLQRQFIDLDEQIEQNYKGHSQQSLSCREIFNQHGEQFFRDSETIALKTALQTPAAVIAVGGGTPLREENQKLIRQHWLVHVTAMPEVVYERLIAHGIPAFFAEKTDPAEFFHALWEQRFPIYAGLADCTIDNSAIIHQTVTQILQHWKELS